MELSVHGGGVQAGDGRVAAGTESVDGAKGLWTGGVGRQVVRDRRQ